MNIILIHIKEQIFLESSAEKYSSLFFLYNACTEIMETLVKILFSILVISPRYSHHTHLSHAFLRRLRQVA